MAHLPFHASLTVLARLFNTLAHGCRRPSEGHPRGRSPRRHSYSPVDRRAVYRSHSSREVAPYPSGGFEPRSAAALPPRPSDRAPGSAWPELYDSAPRRDPVRRSHSECAPLRAEIPWDGHEYDRHYAPSSHPSVSYPYPEPDYPAPTYRQAPIRHSDPREHPYAQSHLEADYRQPLYPSREPHRDRSHSYSRAVEVVHEPYVQPQPAWDILRNDGYDLQKHPPAHHDADDRWHDVQPDRASLHAAPRAPRQAPHHAPRYSAGEYEPPSSEVGYYHVSRHTAAEPNHALRSMPAHLEHGPHQDLQPPPPLRTEESRSLQRHAS